MVCLIHTSSSALETSCAINGPGFTPMQPLASVSGVDSRDNHREVHLVIRRGGDRAAEVLALPHCDEVHGGVEDALRHVREGRRRSLLIRNTSGVSIISIAPRRKPRNSLGAGGEAETLRKPSIL